MEMRSVSGFTLIELVVVIAILAILSAIAVPKFIDLRTEAATAAGQGIAASIASATAINYAASVANTTKATTVLTCAQSVRALQGGVTPTGVSFQAPATAVASGATTACTIEYLSSGISVNVIANIIGASN
jgi:MSHA pilin protein MshA